MRSAHCYVAIMKDFEHFQCFNFETSLLEKRKPLLKKFIESALFLRKTVVSKAIVKTNRMGVKMHLS